MEDWIDQLARVKQRFLKLSLRQQRMLVSEFGTFEVLDRSSKPRVRVLHS